MNIVTISQSRETIFRYNRYTFNIMLILKHINLLI